MGQREHGCIILRAPAHGPCAPTRRPAPSRGHGFLTDPQPSPAGALLAPGQQFLEPACVNRLACCSAAGRTSTAHSLIDAAAVAPCAAAGTGARCWPQRSRFRSVTGYKVRAQGAGAGLGVVGAMCGASAVPGARLQAGRGSRQAAGAPQRPKADAPPRPAATAVAAAAAAAVARVRTCVLRVWQARAARCTPRTPHTR
jgi:hypothetical protein